MPRTQEQLTVIGSSRRLELAIEAYNKDNQILVHTLSASIGSSHSRGSSRDNNTGMNSIRPGKHQSKTKLEDLKSESGTALSNKLSTPKRNFAHNTPFPVHISDNKKALKSGRSSRRESLGSSRGRDKQPHHRINSLSSQEGTGTSGQTSNRRRTNVLSNKSQKEALKSKETTHLEKSAHRSKSKRSRNQSNHQGSAGTLGRLVGMKTTLGASENSLSAT